MAEELNSKLCESPVSASEVPRNERSQAKVRRRVVFPATALVSLCIVQLLMFAALLARIGYIVMVDDSGWTPEFVIRAIGLYHVAMLAASVWGSLIIVFGAWQVIWMRSLTLGYWAAGLACIPVVTPLCLIGMPFGVWLLIVLTQRETIAEFQRVAAMKRERRKAAMLGSLRG